MHFPGLRKQKHARKPEIGDERRTHTDIAFYAYLVHKKEKEFHARLEDLRALEIFIYDSMWVKMTSSNTWTCKLTYCIIYFFGFDENQHSKRLEFPRERNSGEKEIPT